MTVPRITALHMLRSTITTVSAPANSSFRGSITHPTQPLCTLRVRRYRRLPHPSLPGDLLGLTWAGLAPADRASFAWRLPLFDHLVGEGEKRPLNLKVDRFGRREVNDQIELARQLDRQVAWFLTLDNPTCIGAGTAISVGDAWSVAHQATDLRVVARRKARGQCVADRQGDELPTLVDEDRTAADQQRARACLHDRREGSFELAVACRFHNQDLQPEGATRGLCLSQFGFDVQLVRVQQHP